MRDFTTDILQLLLMSLKSANYDFRTVSGYMSSPSSPAVILRHDVDARPYNSLKCAEIEHRLGISGTFYFRAVPGSYDESIIKQISSLGHEIGYHYEDLAASKGDYEKAITSFSENLAMLRRLAPVESICMHGSPMSKHDNRLLWKRYSYKDYGVIGEPYLDIDFQKILYMTDTGRRWDGERFSIRDRVTAPGSTPESRQRFHTTNDLIDAAGKGILPPVMMLTIHPQRWDNRLIPWLYELFWQNSKNAVKGVMTAFYALPNRNSASGSDSASSALSG